MAPTLHCHGRSTDPFKGKTSNWRVKNMRITNSFFSYFEILSELPLVVVGKLSAFKKWPYQAARSCKAHVNALPEVWLRWGGKTGVLRRGWDSAHKGQNFWAELTFIHENAFHYSSCKTSNGAQECLCQAYVTARSSVSVKIFHLITHAKHILCD